jgi:hypothetical protein
MTGPPLDGVRAVDRKREVETLGRQPHGATLRIFGEGGRREDGRGRRA